MERDSSGGPEQGWYIAEPDGTTFGPFTRGEFAAQRARGNYSGEALAWHVDFSEWRPLGRVAVTVTSRAGEASRERAAVRTGNVAVQAQERAKPNKAERKAMRAAAQAGRSPPLAVATTKPTVVDDGRRLLQGAQLARAAARPASPPKPVMKPTAIPGGKATTAEAAGASAARFGVALRRFGARLFDTLTLGMLGACAAYGLAWREIPELSMPTMPLLLWLAVFAVVPLAALCLAIAGKTPGKALFGVRTFGSDGGNPSFAGALKRELDVAWRGMGLGIPVFGLIATVIAGAKYTNEGETTWDRNNRLATRAAGGNLQAALIALVVAFYLLGTSLWPELVVKFLAM